MLLLFAASGLAQVNKDKYPLLKLEEVTTTQYDTFRITAVIKDIYVCPPCPKNAKCKPCIGNHLIVGNLKGSKTYLSVFTEEHSQFKKEKKCVFLLTQRNKLHPEFGTTLIAFEHYP